MSEVVNEPAKDKGHVFVGRKSALVGYLEWRPSIL